MIAPVAACLLAVVAAQATSPEPPPAGSTTSAADVDTQKASGTDLGARFTDPPETGIPMQPYATSPGKEAGGVAMDLGVSSLFRARTLSTTDSSVLWGTDVEVTPGASLLVVLPTFKMSTGYAARLTMPLNTTGSALAVLSSAYLKADWQVAPLWTLTASGTGVFGQNSQLLPATTPGGSGPPPATLDPVRTFETYPYVSLNAFLRASTVLTQRSRLSLSAGYQDVGGVGSGGAAAQPRTWGPMGDVAWSFRASPATTLTTTGSVVDSMLTGNLYILLGTVEESWNQVWTPDLETTLSAGLAASNTDSITFLSVGHLLPVAAARVRFYTDELHQFRLALDATLAPYVDTYVQVSYQRLTGTASLDWYPTRDTFVGAYISAAWVPFSVRAPEAYGTAGASFGWTFWKVFTAGAGAFTQTQLQGPSLGNGAFRQWSIYGSLTLRDHLQF